MRNKMLSTVFSCLNPFRKCCRVALCSPSSAVEYMAPWLLSPKCYIIASTRNKGFQSEANYFGKFECGYVKHLVKGADRLTNARLVHRLTGEKWTRKYITSGISGTWPPVTLPSALWAGNETIWRHLGKSGMRCNVHSDTYVYHIQHLGGWRFRYGRML